MFEDQFRRAITTVIDHHHLSPREVGPLIKQAAETICQHRLTSVEDGY
jgi:hypothetical protein